MCSSDLFNFSIYKITKIYFHFQYSRFFFKLKVSYFLVRIYRTTNNSENSYREKSGRKCREKDFKFCWNLIENNWKIRRWIYICMLHSFRKKRIKIEEKTETNERSLHLKFCGLLWSFCWILFFWQHDHQTGNICTVILSGPIGIFNCYDC